LCCSQIGDQLEHDLVKSGYRWDMKIRYLKIL
jgi:hypothetical protein